jgi:heavy metal sensor kinase
MKSLSVRTKLTLWNVGVLALALCLLGLGIFTGARASLLAAVNKDMKDRANRQVSRISQFLKEQPAERAIHITGVSKGSRPFLIIPGVSKPVGTFDLGKGEFMVSQIPPQQPSNDPTRSQFRARSLSVETGKTLTEEGPYDRAAFLQAKEGHEVFTDITEQTEPVRILSEPVVVRGKIERVLQYPQPLSSTYRALSGLTLTLLTVLPLILVVATFGGAFLTARALKPVREITNTAAQVGAESLAGRLDVKGNDEFSRLAQTFNGMLERLQGAFGRMEQAVEQQRRFTADASHELRTPLTVIKANSSLALKGKRSAEEYQKTLLAVNAAADTMNRLVNDLLLLARSDNGKLDMQKEPTCLKPLLKEAIASVARPGVAEITLHMEDDGAELLGDGHAIIRVFVNLLENAARYTPEDGLITVEQRRDGKDMVVAVRDTGVGIDPEHIPHLCDRFYRVDEARARAEGGNGLGLSICASIVEAHHGTMAITSVPEQGTTVTVRLPAV